MRMVYKGEIRPISSLSAEEMVSIEARSLRQIVRWSGIDNAITVLEHTALVMMYACNILNSDFCVEKPDSFKLLHSLTKYWALHHELDEAFGVGDIRSEIKDLVINREGLDEYKRALWQRLPHNPYETTLYEPQLIKTVVGPASVKEIIKLADIVVGLGEARLLVGSKSDCYDLYTSCEDKVKLCLTNVTLADMVNRVTETVQRMLSLKNREAWLLINEKMFHEDHKLALECIRRAGTLEATNA